ncbi:MAG TPA: phosphatidate cytidylyltransferase [Candidatus Polarisedimenticolia bacterium]|nr:phosphatidate cytidylyltransferase [Candidatus Polarisedimenticolia bacterium]
MKRVLSAAVFLPVFYFLVRLPPIYFTMLIAAACVVGLLELYRLAALRGVRCHRLAGCLLALAVLYTFFDARWSLAGVVVAGAMAVPSLSLFSKRGVDGSLPADALTLFGALFLASFLGYQVALRRLGDELGGDLIFLLFLVVWGGDAAAYYVGSLAGRRPLLPKVSPKKTVEGALAGFLGSLAGALIARAWFFPQLRWRDCLILGVGLAAAGILGDLVESMWKRHAGAKDSAALVPGHGGILDRCDSLLFGGPILYYYFLHWMG